MALSRRKRLYKLNPGEQAILDRARAEKNPNWITNYYLRSPDTGTYWRWVSDHEVSRLQIAEFREAARRWQVGYTLIREQWESLGQPDHFRPGDDEWQAIHEADYQHHAERLERVYRVVEDSSSPEPVFQHPHGVLLLPWQLELFRVTQPTTVVIGGFGSSKTWAKILEMMVHAITLKGYRGFVLAPYSMQSMEVFTQALEIMADTIFEERFLIRSPTKPFPKLVIGHHGVGENTIEFYPILDDPKKILTLTGDEGMVDQAESLPDINLLIRNLGTRLRGMYKGRPRLGKIALLANSGDNPELWDWYDDAITDPENVWAYSPVTHENTYLTVPDLIRYEKQVGSDHASRRMYLFGERPIGSGKHFPNESLAKCRSEALDNWMQEGLEKQIPGFIREEAPKVSIHRWETPPLDDHIYLVCADPGWGDPPYRNSPVVLVWDITSFETGAPARLSAFNWVYGRGSPNPWISCFTNHVLNYKAVGRCAYDGTGMQAGYERFVHGLQDLLAEPINMGGQRKFVSLNLAKKMFADGRFALPGIPALFYQLAKYDLPDERLRQDIVSAILVSASWLERLYYIDATVKEEKPENDPLDRYYREEERYVSRDYVEVVS